MTDDIRRKAGELELSLFRDRWLMVKTLLGNMSPYERQEALDIIRSESVRVTVKQLRRAQEIIDTDDFKIIV